MATVTLRRETWQGLTVEEDPSPNDQETLARSVISHLAQVVLSLDETGEPLARCQAECPNCGAIYQSDRSPYCSDECREQAGFVRQFRVAVASGTVSDPSKKAMFGQNLWHLLGGGYPGRIALIPPKALSKVLARGCELCEQPAVSVDNIGSG